MPEELLARQGVFVDRFGTYRAPFSTAVWIGQSLCERFREGILTYLEAEDRETREKIVHSGSEREHGFSEQRLHEDRAAMAVVGKWCGADLRAGFDETGALKAEVLRLRGIIEELVAWMKQAGHPVKAALVRKSLDNP